MDKNIDKIVLETLCETGKGAPLFLLAPGNRGAAAFKRAAIYIAPLRPVYSLLPPKADDINGFTNITTLANCYANIIESLVEDSSIHIIGYSIGGVTAYETAQVVKMRGGHISSLILIDCLGPRWSTIGRITFSMMRSLPTWFAFLTRITGDQRFVALAHDDRLLGQLILACGYRPKPLDGVLHLLDCSATKWMRRVVAAEWYQLAQQINNTAVHGTHSSLFLEPEIKGLVSELNIIIAKTD